MQGDRKLRVGQAIQFEISQMLQKDLKDPSIGFATITHVKMSADLKHAKIYISVLGSDADKEKTLQGFQRAKGFIRKELAVRLNFRYTPDLIFFIDDTMEKAAHLERLFQKIEEEKTGNSGEEKDDGNESS